jgi:hypothetical protein
VLVVKLFAKTPPLAQLAPTQREAPFAMTQALVLAMLAWIGWSAARAVRPLAGIARDPSSVHAQSQQR